MFKSAKYVGCFRRTIPPEIFRGAPPVGRSASIIIPFGGGAGYLQRLSNCLRSVRWQQHVAHENIEVVLVYLRKKGEQESAAESQELGSLVKKNDVRVIETERSYEHFPLCLARNTGARSAKKETIVFVDADAVLDPEFLARCLRQRGKLVTCWFSYLQKGHGSVSNPGSVRALAPKGKIVRCAYGGGIVAPRTVICEIRGFDEVYDRAWGADDNDMVDRLMEHGLEWYNLTIKENIVNLHQFHPSGVNEESPGTAANRERYYNLKTVVRNEGGWGEP